MRKIRSAADSRLRTQSLERAFGLLRAVAARDGARLTELAAELGLATPTARRILLGLMREGFIEQEPNDRLYFIGPEAYVVGVLASKRHGLRNMAQESLVRLVDASQDSVFLSVPIGTQSLCLERLEGTFPIRSHVLQTGARHPLGVGAGSLAILAAMGDEAVQRAIQANAALLAERFPVFTEDRIWKLVHETRARGFAVNPGLVLTHSWGVGAAVLDDRGAPVAALSIAAIRERLQNDRLAELGLLLRAECERVALAMRGTKARP
ncbi:MAG: IclR family transcriptional regulator [Ramlibacter sp.]|nr:IclR family transcriptional regulator [Ramlibacter sp.]